MLKQINLLKFISYLKFYFLNIYFEKFLVIELNLTHQKFYIKIPDYIELKKDGNYLICYLLSKDKKILPLFNGFYLVLNNYLNSFRIYSRKQLVLSGLGLKLIPLINVIKLKLGFSHIVLIPFSNKFFIIKVKKFGLKGFFISFFNYNKIILGNLVEKIYKTKSADCYKARGFYYKNKEIILKTIKKT
uniref:Ribosomal protein L6 n=1 Tax=Synura synuroidea TaxID=47573 RepID=Q9MGB9_9STRA|nr:ribosomal protein L6 [Synura synuroidea]AAF36930.1 ribosomal protein L6 [Synura synuroidea]